MGPRKHRCKWPATHPTREFAAESFPLGQVSLYCPPPDQSDSSRFHECVQRTQFRRNAPLDDAISALEGSARPDQFTLRRLKKQKLVLKDQIVKIEDQLIPDIIA